MTITLRVHILTAFLCLLVAGGCTVEGPERDTRVIVDTEEARVALSHIGARGGEFFTYRSSSGRKVEFLVYLESSGTYRAVLDACRECYRWRKGYILREGTVVCRKCGQIFDVDSLNDGRGSCVPISLASSRDGNSLAIPISELEASQKYF